LREFALIFLARLLDSRLRQIQPRYAYLAQLPKAVVLVSSRVGVATLLTLASKYGTPVVTRGSGTGLSGGSKRPSEAIRLRFLNAKRLFS
jgi:glycolate oxidase